MYRFIYKTIDYIGKVTPVLIHSPRADSLGNCAEDLFFGLLKAKRENKKVLFLYPQNPIFRRFVAGQKRAQTNSTGELEHRWVRVLWRWLFRNVFLRNFVANQMLFHVQSPYAVNNRFASFVGGWLLTLEIAIMWLCYRSWLKGVRRNRRLVLPRNSARVVFDFDQMTPTIGRSTLWNPQRLGYFSEEIAQDQDWRRQYKEYEPPRMLESDRKNAEEQSVQMGIQSTDWFVCIHVRESGFRSDSEQNRNSSIENYVEGIKVITDAGGWVVRLGDSSMTPLPKMDRVVDYSATQFKSELMDIYLISECRFFIGTNSGPDNVATLFNRPMILVNPTEWTIAFPLKKGDLAIPKHVFSRSLDRFLSVSEILDKPFNWQDFGGGSGNYLMVENTPDEIRDVVQEFLSQPSEFEYSELQNDFNERRNRQIHSYFDHPDSFGRATPDDDIFRMYRIASRLNSAAGTLGQKYLEENWLVDSLESGS